MSTSRVSLRLRRLLDAPVSRVASGSAVGQLALALSIPFVSRLYEASDVGRFAVALSASQIAAILITGRAEQVLPRAAAGHRWGLVLIVLMTSVAAVPVMLVLAFTVDVGVGVVGVTSLTLCTCLFNISGFVFLAERDFSGLARSRGINGMATAVLQVGGGLLMPSLTMLAVTYALGSLVAAALCWPSLNALRDARTVGLRQAAGEERLGRFVSSVGPSGLLSNAALALPTMGIAALYGLEQAATFFLARRVLMVPTQLIARTLSDVNYAQLADRSPVEVLVALRRWLRGFRWPALIVVVGGLAVAPLLHLVVGPQYPHVGATMAILVFPSVVQLVAVSFSNVLLVLGREQLTLVWNALRVASMIGLYALFSVSPDYLRDLVVFAAYSVVIYAVLLFTVFWTARRSAVPAC